MNSNRNRRVSRDPFQQRNPKNDWFFERFDNDSVFPDVDKSFDRMEKRMDTMFKWAPVIWVFSLLFSAALVGVIIWAIIQLVNAYA